MSKKEQGGLADPLAQHPRRLSRSVTLEQRICYQESKDGPQYLPLSRPSQKEAFLKWVMAKEQMFPAICHAEYHRVIALSC